MGVWRPLAATRRGVTRENVTLFWGGGGVWKATDLKRINRQGKKISKVEEKNLHVFSVSVLLDKMLLILLGVLVLHLIILILLTVATAASVSVSSQFCPLKRVFFSESTLHLRFLGWRSRLKILQR